MSIRLGAPVSERGAKVVAAVLALLVLGGLALGARCASTGMARCSVATVFGGAPRLDVPYLATRPALVGRMLDLGEVGAGDRVLDLGTGDGRILRAAAARGASGLGIDIDPVLVAEARDAAARDGSSGRVRFVAQDLFVTPLAGYDVVTMFLLPAVNMRLRPRLLAELAPGARIVSHAFDMGDWQPDDTAAVGGDKAYLWIVPARVAGRWRLDDGRTLDLRQRFQAVAGTLSQPGAWPVAATDTVLRGTHVRFVADGRAYVGEVRGDRIVGADWSARRLPPRAIRATPAANGKDH